ncbi:SCP2 domain-containing protein [Vibrio zhanjiangensis]|uniref:Ubiquinone biosynthesis accessory factor UbiJ n=1 Tax=Vibrio zhanjiangensis TaxID=1046128 RepID=A0ABQ6F2A9_9VIBR|nr:SCP2 domain-containing protein [Vibrio zhanjiangensis]GLT18935.1 SCP2 domain-containing protein [Vibrio zhanjiangensis]
MPFESLVTATIESTLNLLVNDDPELVRRLARLKGRTIQVHLRELNKTLTFMFSQSIDVLAGYEGEPDCFLSLNLAILPQLGEQSNITKLIKEDKLTLEGDIQLAQKFSQLMADCKPDIEEWLSRVMGDILAHQLVQSAVGLGRLAKAQTQKHNDHLAQVITEEWKLAPAPLEIVHFCDQVDDVASRAARVEVKLNKLMDSV